VTRVLRVTSGRTGYTTVTALPVGHMTKLRSLLVLLATLVVPLSDCGGESRRAGTLPAQATDGGDAGDTCSGCDGGLCVEGLCCNSSPDLPAIAGEPCSVAGQFCGSGDCSEADGGVYTCKVCSLNYICSSDDAGSLHWIYYPSPLGGCVK
jgi:hypothetical protein